MAHANSEDAAIAELREEMARTATAPSAFPSPIVMDLKAQRLALHLNRAATVIAALNLPGAALALRDALRQASHVLDILNMAVFIAALAVSLSTYAVLQKDRRSRLAFLVRQRKAGERWAELSDQWALHHESEADKVVPLLKAAEDR